MRKNPPRTKMEPTAPKVLSRYLSGPSVSCHDHCKCVTKEPTDTKPVNLFPRRIPKAPQDKTKLEASNSANRIKKAPSVVPKITTRNVKKGVATEPKSRDMKPKSENSQAKKYNPPYSRNSTRRHSDLFLPNEDMPLPSSRVPKRRLSEIGIRPKKDAVSVSNTSLVRGSRISKNEPKKDSKVSTVNKKPNSIKPLVSSPKRGAKVPTLRSYKSLPQSDLKSPRKSKPKKPIEEVVPEKTLHVDEPNNGVETTETQLHVVEPNDGAETNKTESTVTPDSSPSSEEKVMTHDHNGMQECSPPKEDDTTETDGQYNDNVADSEIIDTKEAIRIGKLVVETTDWSLEDLEFRRGRVLSPLSEGSSPRKLQFRQGNELDENETEQVEKICLRRMSYDGVIRLPESHSVSVDLKHQEIAEKESPSLFNKVIEETANKLIETRQSKVKALVGAFEKVVSGSKPDTLS